MWYDRRMVNCRNRCAMCSWCSPTLQAMDSVHDVSKALELGALVISWKGFLMKIVRKSDVFEQAQENV